MRQVPWESHCRAAGTKSRPAATSGARCFRTSAAATTSWSCARSGGSRFALRLHAYVLMDNHYGLLVETAQPNWSAAMQWLRVLAAADGIDYGSVQIGVRRMAR